MKNEQNSPSPIAHPRPVYPWVVWTLCNLINFYAFLLQFSSWDLISHHIKKDLIFTTDTGMLFAPFALAIILFQIPVALLIDKFGPRKITSLTLIIAALGVILLGYTHSHSLMLFGIFLMGLGGTITYVNSLKLVSNWFSHDTFPFMVAWTIIALIISVLIGQPLILMLVKEFGFSNILINLGMVGILLALVFFFVVRDQHSSVSSQAERGSPIKEFFKSRNSYLIALGGALGITPWLSSTGFWHHIYYKVAYGMDTGDSAFITFIDYLVFGAGALFFSTYGRKVGKRKLLMAGGVLSSLLVTCLILFVPRFSFPSVMILTLVGTFFISSITLIYTLICENIKFKAVGLAVGTIWFTVVLLRFIGNQLITWIITGTNKLAVDRLLEHSTVEFQKGLLVMPVLLLLSFICMIFIKEPYGK